MRLIIILGLSVALAYFITGGFSGSTPPHQAAAWDATQRLVKPLPVVFPPLSAFSNVYIGNSPGVVTRGKVDQTDEGWLRLYNEDGTLWYRFSVYEYEPERWDSDMHRDLAPLCFSIDYFCLALRQAGDEGDRWRVVVNEESGLTKFVEKADSTFKYVTWSEYLLGDAVVAFDVVHTSPDEASEVVPVLFEAFADLVRVDGDWIELKWKPYVDRDSIKHPSGRGWTRWRKDGYFLLHFSAGC